MPRVCRRFGLYIDFEEDAREHIEVIPCKRCQGDESKQSYGEDGSEGSTNMVGKASEAEGALGSAGGRYQPRTVPYLDGQGEQGSGVKDE
jgi:hypothetical protein